MSDTDIRIVSNEAGEATAVIVPIALWREISSERETAYLLQSDTMRQRLLAGLQRTSGVPLDDAIAQFGLLQHRVRPERTPRNQPSTALTRNRAKLFTNEWPEPTPAPQRRRPHQ